MLKLVEGRIEPSVPLTSGAAVVLNSGGPNMLVQKIMGNEALCVWICEEGFMVDTFLLTSLTLLGDVNILQGVI